MLESTHFPSRVVRSGVSSAFFRKVVCCKCHAEDECRSWKNLPDQVISNKFRDKGWVIAKRRNDDICPTCIKKMSPSQKLATAFDKVTENGVAVPAPAGPKPILKSPFYLSQQRREQEREEENRMRESLSNISKKIPDTQPSMVDAYAPKVPIKVSEVKPKPEPKEEVLPLPNLADVAREIANGIAFMGSEIGNLRAAMELMIEQQTTLIGAVGSFATRSALDAKNLVSASDNLLHSTSSICKGLQMLSLGHDVVAKLPEPVAEIVPPKVAATPEPKIAFPKLTKASPPKIASPKVAARDAYVDDEAIRVLGLYDKTGNRYIVNVRVSNDIMRKFGWDDKTPVAIDIEGKTVVVRRAASGEHGKHPKITNNQTTTYQRSVKHFVNFSSRTFGYRTTGDQLEVDLSPVLAMR